MPEYTSPSSTRPLHLIVQLIWYAFSIVEALLLFRFLLKFIGANSNAQFTQLIYKASNPLVAPFAGLVRSPTIVPGILEWSTLIALLVYWIVVWSIVWLTNMVRPVSEEDRGSKTRH